MPNIREQFPVPKLDSEIPSEAVEHGAQSAGTPETGGLKLEDLHLKKPLPGPAKVL